MCLDGLIEDFLVWKRDTFEDVQVVQKIHEGYFSS